MSCATEPTNALKDSASYFDDDFITGLKPLQDYMQIINEENYFGQLDSKLGTSERIGVFGSYLPPDRRIINSICEYIAKKGYIVCTGKGYYHPTAPNVYQPLASLLSTKLNQLIADQTKDKFFFMYILPEMITKAICRIMPLRTQQLELIGCDKDKLCRPVFGFADTIPLKKYVKEKCNWIDKLNLGSDYIMDCKLNTMKSCPVDSGRQVHCIYYQHSIPQVIKTMFMENQWEYYSVTDYQKLYPYIDAFLVK